MELVVVGCTMLNLAVLIVIHRYFKDFEAMLKEYRNLTGVPANIVEQSSVEVLDPPKDFLVEPVRKSNDGGIHRVKMPQPEWATTQEKA